VGNVSSGDAKAASGVANIFNSILNVKHWFGVLVINVFGDWLGDVNDNSPAGTQASDASTNQSSGGADSLPRVFMSRIFPASSAPSEDAVGTTGVSGGGIGGSGTQVSSGAEQGSRVLTAAASQPNDNARSTTSGGDTNVLFGLSALVMLIAGALAGLEKRLKASK
jgi:hypothetical protein